MIFIKRQKVASKTIASYRNISCWLCVMAVSVPYSFGAVVTLQPPETTEGLIAVPIYIAPEEGDQMASLQFDFNFDAVSMHVTSVETGACASQAAKDVMSSPLGDSTVRVVVAGMNQNTLGEGVVAMVYMERVDDGSTASAMELDSVVVSDPIGNAVESTYENLTGEESTEAESDTSGSTSDATSEAILSDRLRASSADKSLDKPVRQSDGTWSSGAWTEKQTEDSKVLGDSALKGSSKVIPDNRASRIHVNMAGDRPKDIAPRSPASQQRKYPSGHGSTAHVSGADKIRVPDKLALATSEARVHTFSGPKNTVALLAPPGNVGPGVARKKVDIKHTELAAGSRIYASWNTLWFLVPIVVILATMAAQWVLIGRVRKSRVDRMR